MFALLAMIGCVGTVEYYLKVMMLFLSGGIAFLIHGGGYRSCSCPCPICAWLPQTATSNNALTFTRSQISLISSLIPPIAGYTQGA